MTTKKINVEGKEIAVVINNNDDDSYISLTDMVRDEDGEDHIRNWMRNKNTIEYLGTWESINNPNFKGVEFDTFLSQAGLNRFNMTPRKWIEATNAIGIVSKAGRYGGTYAHKDIAFEFGAWISPAFKLYLIKEYQRLKAQENNPLIQQWDVKRLLSKTNYRLHTDAIKEFIIPQVGYDRLKHNIAYAEEADMLNIALFGCTAAEWEEANPGMAQKLNIRDTATINQLIVLSNMESYNSEMIKDGVDRMTRFSTLHKMAKDQLARLDASSSEQQFRRLSSDNKEIE